MKPITTVWLGISWLTITTATAAESGPVAPFEADRFAVGATEIDRLAFAAMAKAKVTPALPCSDEVFLRRAYLDIVGRIPTAAEAESFLAYPGSDKRSRLIDHLP